LKNQTVYDRNGDGGTVSCEGDDGLGGEKECMKTGVDGCGMVDGERRKGHGPEETRVF